MGKSIEIGTSPRLVITPGAGAEAQPMMLADAITCTVVLENKPLPCPPSPSTSTSTTSTTMSTTCSSSELPKSSNPKKVRFGETNQAILKTIHCYHQPDDDEEEEEEGRVSTWLSHADYKRIRDASFAVIREHKRQLKTGGTGILEDGSDNDNDTVTKEWTWRGFDYVLERHPRTMIRQTHCQDVLKFQQVLLCHCPAALATYAANSSATLGSEARALRLGQEMQLEGFPILHPESSLSCAMTVHDKKQDEAEANSDDAEDTNSVVDGSSNSYVAANYCDPSHPENLPRLVPFLWRAALQFFHCVY